MTGLLAGVFFFLSAAVKHRGAKSERRPVRARHPFCASPASADLAAGQKWQTRENQSTKFVGSWKQRRVFKSGVLVSLRQEMRRDER